MKIVTTALVALALGAVTFRAGVEAQDRKTPVEGSKVFKAVIHINFSDAERQKHGLKNVANMLKEVGDKFEIEVVCHGSGIGLVVKDQTQHAAEVERLHKQGVRFAACENTMREKTIAKEGLLPGVETVPSGAVEVVRKQQDGYGYFKP
jgi:intracellular sulfur oxidation DsrE/DsrF family protein